MQILKPFTQFDNYRLYLRLKKAGDSGNKDSARLARKIGRKFRSKAFLKELEFHQMQELTRKALAGNTRAIQKIYRMQADEQKQIIEFKKRKILGNGRNYKSYRNAIR